MVFDKLLIVTSHYPPLQSGVSDYTKKLFQYLSRDIDVRVLTNIRPTEHEQEVEYLDINWTSINDLKKIEKYLEKNQRRQILIEYVPYMYGRLGINLVFPFFIFYLSVFRKIPISTYFHEVNYPFERTLKSFILYSLHRFQAKILCSASTNILTSCLALQKTLKKIAKKDVHILEIGSNIDIFPSEKRDKFSSIKRGAVVFGGFHPSKCFDWVYEICFEQKISLIHIGVKKEDVPLELKKFIADEWIYTSYLQDQDISQILQAGFPVLCPFIDGASTRRGTLIAAIIHGAKTFSTLSENTESLFYDFSNLILSKNKKDDFKNLISSNISQFDSSQTNPLSDHPFMWQKICKKLLKILGI